MSDETKKPTSLICTVAFTGDINNYEYDDYEYLHHMSTGIESVFNQNRLDDFYQDKIDSVIRELTTALKSTNEFYGINLKLKIRKVNDDLTFVEFPKYQQSAGLLSDGCVIKVVKIPFERFGTNENGNWKTDVDSLWEFLKE